MEKKALELHAERLELAMSVNNDGMYDWNVPKGEVYFDPRYYTLAGYEPDEFPHQYEEWVKRVHPDDFVALETAVLQFLQGETQKYDEEFRFLHKNGDWMWIRARVKIFERDEAGAPLRIIGTHTDITEHKRSEEQRRNLEKQLQQSHKLKALGSMVGGIAHEFNNILSIITSNVDAAQQKLEANSSPGKNIDNIKETSSQAKELIKQLLAFCRLDPQSIGSIDIARAANKDIELLRSMIPATVEIKTAIKGEPCIIRSNATQVQQVLVNLCTNALHAMDEKGVLQIELETTSLSDPETLKAVNQSAGSYARLSVGDTGSGMDKETKNSIFDPFFTTKEAGKGTGLGLSVVYGIVEQSGGFITVDSHLGQGTTFNVYFPIIKGIEVETAMNKPETLPTGAERILFVDDEECITETCSELLECQGYKVTGAMSSDEAIELFRANPTDFDLIITDQTMPGMTGAEMAAELLKTREDIPIILCTGYSATLSEQEARQMGISEYCQKPMDIKQLATVVRKVLDNSVADKS